MKKLFFLFVLFSLAFNLMAQQEIKLYPKGAKESNGLTVGESFRRADFVIDISDPRMYHYPASKESSNGTAVLICPGGGYSGVSIENEGSKVAEWFNEQGVSAFVLYYRMPNEHCNIPLLDAQEALKIIHKNARKWNIDKNKIGIIGFSAGGHLASTVGTHFKTKKQRPAFMILGYPVVSMKYDITHKGSKANLLGKTPTEKMVKLYSNELQVTKHTPPTFIFHAKDDKAVPIANSEKLNSALYLDNVPVEFQAFEEGGHGFGMRKQNIPADEWPELLKKWMIKQGFLSKI